jgi:hypothetical protein
MALNMTQKYTKTEVWEVGSNKAPGLAVKSIRNQPHRLWRLRCTRNGCRPLQPHRCGWRVWRRGPAPHQGYGCC